jgi:hypothetical protein
MQLIDCEAIQKLSQQFKVSWMWLELKQQYPLIRHEPNESAIPWQVDVRASVDFDTIEPGQPQSFIVGRMLADEIRRYESNEWGHNNWDVAEADSMGLETAYASLLDEEGEIREFNGMCDPIVYLYRFAMHDDFAEWRLPLLDAFCRQFDNFALILAQHHTTWFSLEEFKLVGFEMLEQTEYKVPPGYREIDSDLRFMVRDNSLKTKLRIEDYPKECRPATIEHQNWGESKGRWEGLI